MHPLVLFEMPRIREIFAALQTVVRTLSRVNSLVPFQVPRRGEILTALKARERSFSAVYFLMSLDIVNSEVFSALLAVVRSVCGGSAV